MEVPDNVFDDRHAFEAFLARMGGDPRRDGEELIAYLQGWLERNEACATGQRREDAQRLIRELRMGLESLYAQDVVVARLEDELDMLRERQEQHIAQLRLQYRKMVFWRGRNDDDVLAAAAWVRQEFSAEAAAQIHDTSELFDEDIPRE